LTDYDLWSLKLETLGKFVHTRQALIIDQFRVVQLWISLCKNGVLAAALGELYARFSLDASQATDICELFLRNLIILRDFNLIEREVITGLQ
jgi:hypothetical protein